MCALVPELWLIPRCKKLNCNTSLKRQRVSVERGGLNSESKQAVLTSFIYNAGREKPQRSGSMQKQQYIRVTVHQLVSVKECSVDAFIHVWSKSIWRKVFV